jgi:predicted aspartyl protease
MPIPIRIMDLHDRGCHIMCSGRVNGYKMNFLIDTGASMSVLDMNRLKMICPHQELIPYHKTFTGIGKARIDTWLTHLDKLEMGDFLVPQLSLLVVDLSNINEAYASLDLDRVDGVLGGDILLLLKARIDYLTMTLTPAE